MFTNWPNYVSVHKWCVNWIVKVLKHWYRYEKSCRVGEINKSDVPIPFITVIVFTQKINIWVNHRQKVIDWTTIAMVFHFRLELMNTIRILEATFSNFSPNWRLQNIKTNKFDFYYNILFIFTKSDIRYSRYLTHYELYL